MKQNRNTGFTLIELLVVIAIIGILASIAVVALSESREHSRNTARATQIREYQKAIEYYYSENGFYPRANETTATATACLGDYAPYNEISGNCWQIGSAQPERAWFVNALTPKYMARIPEADNTVFGEGTTYVGMYYQYANYGKEYTIWYFMKGPNKDCLLPNTTSSQIGNDTRCQLVVRS